MKSKSIFPISFILLSVFSVFAQEPNISFILNQSETGSTKQYLASDRVTLKSGFVYNAAQGKTFNAKIDKTLPLPANSSTYINNGSITTDPQGGAIVGAVSGSAAVTPTGAATYQIPIEVPTGIAGMQPQVAVVYNSQGGFGNLGTGWDIAGTSAITRGGKNLYFDNENNSVKFDNTDALYLDGQRLIHINSYEHSNLTPGAEYGTEVESFVRVKVMDNGTGSIYFVVTTKDGKIMEYGNTVNSIVRSAYVANDLHYLGWKLNRVCDLYNNYMTYTYIENGQYLQKIDYTGNGATMPAKSVVFSYNEILAIPKQTFVWSFQLKQNKLLSNICTYSGTTKLKDYRFGYVAAGVDKHLDNVSEYAKDGSKLNATRVNWGSTGALQLTTINSIIGTVVDQPAEAANLNYADINGDGYNDRIEMWVGGENENGAIWVYLFDKATNNYLTTSISINFNYSDYKKYKPKFIFSDVNHDGLNEIIFTNGGYLYVYKFQNGAFTYLNGINTSDNTNVHYVEERSYELISQDVNQDNINDVIIIYNSFSKPGESYAPGYIIYNGSSTGLSYLDSGFFPDESFNIMQIGNFEANGKPIIVGLNKYSTTGYVFPKQDHVIYTSCGTWGQYIKNNVKFKTADFNGDGISDILSQSPTSHEWVILENKRDFTVTPTLVNIDIHEAWNVYDGENYEIYPIDYNGDGLSDLILGDETCKNGGFLNLAKVYDYTTWYCYKNLGNGNFQLEKTDVSNNRIRHTNGAVTDINNDGVADLVLPIGSSFKAFTKPSANRASLVTGLTDGMGRSVSYVYTNYANFNTDATNISDVQNLNAPLLVANSITNVDGKAITYTYEKAKVHTRGKGMLGFGVVTVKNQTDNAQISTEYEINPTYYGVSQNTQTIKDYSGTTTLSTSTQTNDVKVVDAARKRYIPTVTAQTTTDNVKNLTQSSSAIFDNFGNATSQTTIAGDDNDKITTIVETDYKVRTGGTVEYLPETVTTTRKKSGETDVVRTVAYDYNDNGKLTKETKDPADVNKLITEYKDFDTWGHPCTVEVSITGKPVRKSTMAYTPSGYFVANKTNHLLEATSYVWDEALCLLKSETDHSGTTTYSYDAWNKPLMVTYPEGYRKGTAVQWAAGAVPGAVYYTYEETKGSSPVWTWYNTLGQEVRKDYYGLNEKKICVSTEYNAKKQVYQVSDPYFETESASKTWAATYTYDSYGRPQTVTTSRDVSTMAYNVRVESVSRTVTGETTPFFTSSKELNSAGLLKTSTENGKSVSFTYYPSGLTKTTTPQGGQALSMEYNLQGQRKKLVDPDAGEVLTTYNGFGELTEEKQKVHTSQYIVTTNNYNNNGTINNIVRNGETTTYTYGDPSHKGRPTSISIANKHTRSFYYDGFDRLYYSVEEIENVNSFGTYYEYDMYGRETAKQYPSYYTVYNTYDKYGNLTEVKDGSNRPIWKAVAENARGQITQERKGNYDTYYGFDNRGLPSYNISGNAIDMYYYFNNKGNLQYRADNNGNEETFVYDTNDRLTNWNVTAGDGDYSKNNALTYDPATGTISSKTDIGDFKYGTANNEQGAVNPNPGPHALTSVAGPLTSLQSQTLNVTYTDFKKIATLHEGSKDYVLTYGVDDQRRKSEYYANGILQGAPTLTRYYLGDYEEEIDALGNVKQIHYLSGAIMITTITPSWEYEEHLYYSYTDYQGSLIALTDESGTVVERYAYDPWGARRNPDNWTESDTRTSWIVNRGYTGHEHLDAFGIINMNGRVYDPLMAMFFSPDPVLDGNNWLSYNRYGYCMGNPFKYTDPSGEFPWLIVGLAISSGISYLSGVRDTGWSNWTPQWSGVLGYSSTGGFYLGISTNGGAQFSNFGLNSTGFTAGATINGVTNMEQINCAPLNNAVVWTVGAYDYYSDWDAVQRDLTDWDAWQDAIPVWGSSRQAGYALNQGEYLSAAQYFGLGLFEMFTLGIGSEYAMGAKSSMTSSIPKRVYTAVPIEQGGGFTSKIVEGAAKGGANAIEQVAVHGNSLKSLKPTWGYKLYSADGTFLKNGITSKLVPQSRYTRAFMSDKIMVPIEQFPNRLGAWQWEFQQNQILRGPLNLNMH